MKKIREWLSDYFALIEGNEMEKILADVGERMVNSFEEARRQVNLRIDMMISWLDGVRPALGPMSVTQEWLWNPGAYE